MSKQKNLGLKPSKRRSRKEVLFNEIVLAMSRTELVELISAKAPVGEIERLLFELEMMLCINHLQRWIGLANLADEEALFKVSICRDVVGLSGTTMIPDRVSNLRFCHLLEAHGLSPRIVQIFYDKLSQLGLLPKTGTVVANTLIAAPSSTKNSPCKRDSAKRQTNRDIRWRFGTDARRPCSQRSTREFRRAGIFVYVTA